MRKTESMKDIILLKKLKAEDPIELPMDDAFFDNLHDKIMSSVEKTEIKPVSKWQKSWIFLEKKTVEPRDKVKKAAKVGVTAATLIVGANLINYGINNFSERYVFAQNETYKSIILSEAERNPTEWADLVVNYQDENDFYADVLSQRDAATIVEIDKVISQSL